MGRLTVVDVGHGSCTVIESSGEVCVVDAPQKGGAKQFLASRKLRRLKYVVESHGHTDHAGGLLNLVTDGSITIDRFLCNPEHKRNAAGKPTLFETRMDRALRIGRKKGTSVVTAVTSDATGTFTVGALSVTVLWPTGPTAYAGLGAASEFGRLTSNSLSVVLRVESSTGFSVLIPGDLDAIGLSLLLAELPRLKSDVVIAPHHGGLMGTAQQTAKAWTRISHEVAPTEVIVSIGREQSANPRDEVIRALVQQGSVRLRCTQLSEQCGTPAGFAAVSSHWSRGETRGECCAGSVVIDLTAGVVLFAQEHDDRVARLPSAACKPLLPQSPVQLHHPE